MKSSPFASLLICAVVCLSCKKEAAVEKNASTVSYQLQGINPQTQVLKTNTAQRVAGASIKWTSALASVTAIKFEAESATGEVEFSQTTKGTYDLLASPVSIGNISVAAGTYTEVEFKAFLAPSGGNPSLVLKGEIALAGGNRSIVLKVTGNTELKAEKKNVTVTQGVTYNEITKLDFSQLTRGITESEFAAAQLTNGELTISPTVNKSLYEKMIDNLNKHHGEAGFDHH